MSRGNLKPKKGGGEQYTDATQQLRNCSNKGGKIRNIAENQLEFINQAPLFRPASGEKILAKAPMKDFGLANFVEM